VTGGVQVVVFDLIVSCTEIRLQEEIIWAGKGRFEFI
jgi:hypothetical protein